MRGPPATADTIPNSAENVPAHAESPYMKYAVTPAVTMEITPEMIMIAARPQISFSDIVTSVRLVGLEGIAPPYSSLSETRL